MYIFEKKQEITTVTSVERTNKSNQINRFQADRRIQECLKEKLLTSTIHRITTHWKLKSYPGKWLKSRKFNGKKELLKEKYLDSIKIYRLTISCPRCANSIAFRTDPGNSDYVMEVGGVRNYVPQKPNDDLNAKTAVESIDETLQRLVREKEMEQNEKMGIKEQADDKMDLLEKRLAKIQQEQEDDEELENLRKKNLEMSQRAEMINRSKHAQQEKAVTTDDLDNLVDQVFDNHRQRTNKPGNNNDEKRTPLFNPTSTKGKIQKKSSVRTNPLGIVIKRGKSLK